MSILLGYCSSNKSYVTRLTTEVMIYGRLIMSKLALVMFCLRLTMPKFA